MIRVLPAAELGAIGAWLPLYLVLVSAVLPESWFMTQVSMRSAHQSWRPSLASSRTSKGTRCSDILPALRTILFAGDRDAPTAPGTGPGTAARCRADQTISSPPTIGYC